MSQNLIYFLVALLVALQVADIATTYLALDRKKGTEANGLLAPLFVRFGVLPTLIVVKGGFIGLLLWGHPYVMAEVLAALTLVYVLVVFNNMKVLLK